MIEQDKLFKALAKIGINFYTGVPDSFLNDFCSYLSKNMPNNQHVMAANEGNAIGIAVGNYLSTGNIPLVYMQNSGIGNATNPLLSLAHSTVYSIPMILLIGWRGDPSINDHAQHRKQGELTTVLLKDMDIKYDILDDEKTVIDKFQWAHDTAKSEKSPVALIAKKGILTQKEKHQNYPDSPLMSREEAISEIIDLLGEDAVYLATTGRATRELHEQLAIHGISQDIEFLNVGAMGHLSSIGLGIALGAPTKRIVVFDGDAAAVMHMGCLATNGRYRPNNLIHIILNNGVNESVGGQPSSGHSINMTEIANACGYLTPDSHVSRKEDLLISAKALLSQNRLSFIDVHVRQGIRNDIPKLQINHLDKKEKLMKYIREK